jgi:hypothetical protein
VIAAMIFDVARCASLNSGEIGLAASTASIASVISKAKRKAATSRPPTVAEIFSVMTAFLFCH